MYVLMCLLQLTQFALETKLLVGKGTEHYYLKETSQWKCFWKLQKSEHELHTLATSLTINSLFLFYWLFHTFENKCAQTFSGKIKFRCEKVNTCTSFWLAKERSYQCNIVGSYILQSSITVCVFAARIQDILMVSCLACVRSRLFVQRFNILSLFALTP